MSSNCCFNIIKEHNLILEYYYGDIYLLDFISLLDSLYNSKDYHPDLNILADTREANIIYEEKQLEALAVYLKTNKKHVKPKKLALLTITPRQVVAGTLFGVFSREIKIVTNTFSVVETAAAWLGISSIDVEQLIRELYLMKQKILQSKFSL